MMRDIKDVVSYVAREEEWQFPRCPLLQRLLKDHPWQDVRSSLGYLLQWLHVNLVRDRPQALPLNPRFGPVYSNLLAQSTDFSRIFEISGDSLDYIESVPQSERREIEQYASTHFRPETVV